MKHFLNIWKGIKQIITLKPQRLNVPTKIIHENHVTTDLKALFANIGNQLFNNIPPNTTSLLDYLNPPMINSFHLYLVTNKEVIKEIASLSSGKSTGPFGIPVNILKIISSIVSQPLAEIFNLSFNTGVVPEKFKIAKSYSYLQERLSYSFT